MAEKQKIDVKDISNLVAAGAKRAWAEKEPVLLIGLLEGAVMAAVFWPAVRLNFAALQLAGGKDSAQAEAFLADALGLWPLYMLMLLFNAVVTVVIARLAAKERGQTLAGGLPALGRRLLWLLWRSLGAIGWILVGIAVLWLATMIVVAPLSWLAGGGAGAADGALVTLLEGILIVLLVGGVLFLSGALGLSLISECADHHLAIRRAWGLLRGQRIKLAAAIFVIYLGTAVINGALMALAPRDAASLEDMRLFLSVLHVAVTIVGTFFTFLWFSMTAIAGEKIDWAEPDAEPETDPADD